MSIVQSEPDRTLVEAARALALGGDLDSRLATFTEQARLCSGAALAVMYLYDAESGALVVAAAAGADAALLDSPSLAPDDAADPVARVIVERRPSFASVAEGRMLGMLAAARPGLASASLIPLLVEDEAGTPAAQGVLVCAFEPGTEADPDDAALGALADLAAVAVRLARLEYALQERVDWYERVAHTDPLTGLANRRTFERMLELEIARAARQATPISLVIFDVDDAASLMARAGGSALDDVLRRVASTLAEQVRLVDTVARIGPDRFSVIAPGAMGGLVARRVRDAVAVLEPAAEARISVSAGVARFPDEASTAEELLAAAERAMADAKQQGPGAVVAGHEAPA